MDAQSASAFMIGVIIAEFFWMVGISVLEITVAYPLLVLSCWNERFVTDAIRLH